MRQLQNKLVKAGINCSVQLAKGTAEQNRTYCMKDGKFHEWGELPKQGKRTDIDKMMTMIKEGKTSIEVAEELPNTWTKYFKAADRYRKELRQEKQALIVNKEFQEVTLRDWQKKVLGRLEIQDDRKVLWVVDEKGNSGKTWLGKYLQAIRGAFLIKGGKHADVAYAYSFERIVVFDYSREQEERVSYSQIEKFKDGSLFSPKYESELKRFKACQVIVFSNFYPDKSKLSKDRWDVEVLHQFPVVTVGGPENRLF